MSKPAAKITYTTLFADESIHPKYETALKAAGIKYEAFHYPGTQHGFNNDTTPRYDPAAAEVVPHFALAACAASSAASISSAPERGISHNACPVTGVTFSK